jgi:hypothetical protein
MHICWRTSWWAALPEYLRDMNVVHSVVNACVVIRRDMRSRQVITSCSCGSSQSMYICVEKGVCACGFCIHEYCRLTECSVYMPICTSRAARMQDSGTARSVYSIVYNMHQDIIRTNNPYRKLAKIIFITKSYACLLGSPLLFKSRECPGNSKHREDIDVRERERERERERPKTL